VAERKPVLLVEKVFYGKKKRSHEEVPREVVGRRSTPFDLAQLITRQTVSFHRGGRTGGAIHFVGGVEERSDLVSLSCHIRRINPNLTFTTLVGPCHTTAKDERGLEMRG